MQRLSTVLVYVSFLWPVASTSAIAASDHRAATEPSDAGEQTRKADACRQLMQAWMFNRLLEASCDFNGVVSLTIGSTAKAGGCDDIVPAAQRDAYFGEVIRDFKADIDNHGKDALCAEMKSGYDALQSEMSK